MLNRCTNEVVKWRGKVIPRGIFEPPDGSKLLIVFDLTVCIFPARWPFAANPFGVIQKVQG